ncbi:MAG: hypothetical protein L0206_12480 [Actinobacteria bacterium]|nr:hypothetical protein [Actinomycetota bacterium]
MGTLSLGWGRPLGGGGSGEWDWWALAGAVAIFLLVVTARRRPPAAVAILLAAIGGLVVAGLTEAWGVVPVWGTMLVVVMSRNLRRGTSQPHV